MRRRVFIAMLGGATVTWPIAARAQQAAMPVIGVLMSPAAQGFDAPLAAFRRGLGESGYVEGQNLAIEFHWAEGHNERLPELAADLVRRQVAVIVASGGDAPALAAKAATETIPIVFISGGEPVKAGLVASLSRPGGNVTGVSFISTTLAPKRLDLLHQLVPKAEVIGVLVNPSYPDADLQRRDLQHAAATIGLQVHFVGGGTPPGIDAAFAMLVQQGIDTVLVANDPFFLSRSHQIVALAQLHAVVAFYFEREFVDAGGLISYGPSLADAYQLAGNYTGKVLNGAKPADLPVQLPTKFELVINLRTAKALGLTIPQSLVVSADELID